MKSLKTAPQILEHYVGENTLYCIDIPSEFSDVLLKAMRHYARIRIEKEYEKLYQEASENFFKQHDL